MRCFIGWSWWQGCFFLIASLLCAGSSVHGQAAADFYTTPAGTTLSIDAPGVLANDIGGGNLSAALLAGPANGTLNLNGDGSFTYSPATNFTGVDGFTYQASDNSQTSSVTSVAIMVLAPGQLFYDNFARPAGSMPVFPWIQELQPQIAGSWNIAGQRMIGAGPANNYALIYYPNDGWTDYSVQAQFRFDTDNAASAGILGRLDEDTGAHYALWVYPENSPEIYASGNGTAVLRLFKYQTWGWPYIAVGNPVTLPGIGVDWHSVKLAFQGNNISAYFDGRLMMTVVDDGSLDGNPPCTYGGIGLNLWTLPSMPYTFTVNDVIVSTASNSIANADVYETFIGTPLSVGAPGLLGNDTGNGPLNARLVNGPTSGSLTLTNSGGFTYLPDPDFSGPDSFTYQCTDGETTSAVVTVNLYVNTTALAVDDSFRMAANSMLNVDQPGVLANDVGNGTLTAWIVNGPADGSLTFTTNGGFAYVPAADYSGNDSFTYQCTDGQSTSAVATVTLQVLPPPNVSNYFYSVTEGTDLNVPAPGLLLDASNGLSAILAGGPVWGTLTWGGDGSFSYQAPTNYIGMDSFIYQARDGPSTSRVATADIMVTPPGSWFYDNFVRGSGSDTLFPWVSQAGVWDIANHFLSGTSADNSYGYAYYENARWTDYSVQAQVQFSSANAWGGGIGGHLDPASGAHYAAWIYPEGSPAPWAAQNQSAIGAATLQIIKFEYWTLYTKVGNAIALPAVGTNWHTLKLAFQGSNIFACFDGNRVANFTDDGSFDQQAAYTSGGISIDLWTASSYDCLFSASNVTVNPLMMNHRYRVPENTPLTVTNPGLLSSETDIYGTNLTVTLVAGPTNGTLNLSADGGFSYLPAPGFTGMDGFTVQASDSQNPVGTLQAAITVVPVVTLPAPVILSIGLTNNLIAIAWSSVAGHNYQLQSIDSLTGTNWNDLSPNVTATGPVTGQTNVISNPAQQFYRILLLSP